MVYNNVIKYCKKNGISISAFEQKCGLSNGLVGKWRENNFQPSIETLQKIVSATDVPISDWLK